MSGGSSVEAAVLRTLEAISEEIERGGFEGELSRKVISKRSRVAISSITRNKALNQRVTNFLESISAEKPKLVSKHGRTGHVQKNIRRVLAELEQQIFELDDFDGRLSLREICRRAECDPAALRRHSDLKDSIDDFIGRVQKRTTTTVATTTQRRKERIRQLERENAALAAHVVHLETELNRTRAHIASLQNAKPNTVVSRDVFGRPRSSPTP